MNAKGLCSKLLRLEKVVASQGQAVGSIAEMLKAARERRQEQGPGYMEEWKKRKDPAYGLDLNSRIGKHLFEARKKRLEEEGGGSS